jgi:hypothetical protein
VDQSSGLEHPAAVQQSVTEYRRRLDRHVVREVEPLATTIVYTAAPITGRTWREQLHEDIRKGFATGVQTIFPAVNERFAELSLESDAMTIFDLEDSLAPLRKAEGRHYLSGAPTAWGNAMSPVKTVFVGA